MPHRQPRRPSYSRASELIRVLLVLLLLLGSTAVSQAQTASSAAPTSGKTSVPAAGVDIQNPSSDAQAPSQAPPPPQGPITKKEARDLFRSVDEILRFVSVDTALPIKHKVKRKLITRQSMERSLEKRMKDDKDTQRVERSEFVLKKFGLLPPDYDLHTEFLKLLGEQVAAYYDPKTKTVNLLDWVQPDLQKPVLAHELTHALQDQKVGLEKWSDAGANPDKPAPDRQEQVIEEEQAARQCVTEGQAMVELLNYTLAPLGKSVVTDPAMIDAMRAGMTDTKDSPVFSAAPMFIKESLMMPYTFGLDFVRRVLVDKGREAAFAGMLEQPPVDTRQIMEPSKYLAGDVVSPLDVPDLDKLVAPTYERFDFGGMGEFDVYLLAKQYRADDPKSLYRHWRGGYYFAAHAKTAPEGEIALLYVSRWDSPEAAQNFAAVYAGYVPKRYKRAASLTPVSLRAGSASPQAGDHDQNAWSFNTEHGRVIIEVHGSDLLVMEGFSDDVIAKTRDALFPPTAQAHPDGEPAAMAAD